MLSSTYISLVQRSVITLVKVFLIVTGRLKIVRSSSLEIHPSKRYIVAANHASYADPLVLWGALTLQQLFAVTPVKVMTGRGIYFSSLLPFIWGLGAFPAKARTGKNDAAGIDAAVKYLGQGYNIGIFPEGGRTLPSAKRSYPGIVRLLESHPEAELILVHLVWTAEPVWRRRLELRVQPAGEHLDRTDADKIMEALYAV